jgi:hypothetical protein
MFFWSSYTKLVLSAWFCGAGLLLGKTWPLYTSGLLIHWSWSWQTENCERIVILQSCSISIKFGQSKHELSHATSEHLTCWNQGSYVWNSACNPIHHNPESFPIYCVNWQLISQGTQLWSITIRSQFSVCQLQDQCISRPVVYKGHVFPKSNPAPQNQADKTSFV